MQALAVLTQLRLFMSVDRIAQNRVADMGHMNTNLVGASRLQLAAHVGITPVAPDHLPVGHRIAGIAGSDGHLLPVGRMAADGGIHSSGVLPEAAADNGLVGSGHGVILQLGGQHRVGKVVFRHRQKAGGILVDAVDDAGAQLAVDAGKVITQGMHQTVHQGIILVSRRRPQR